MIPVALTSSPAAMDVAFKNAGYAITTMTVATVRMRRIAPKCHVAPMNLPVRMVPAFTRNGNVMEIRIVMMVPMKW